LEKESEGAKGMSKRQKEGRKGSIGLK
jgi:hypothetical protein